MTRVFPSALLLILLGACAPETPPAASAPTPARTTTSGEPDYREWQELLSAYYDPARGMDYGGLKRQDAAKLRALRERLSGVDVATLTPQQRLAFLINLYNVNVVGIVVDRYPVDSIRDISTDPVTRMNVFKKELVPFGGTMISLDAIEHERIRKVFNDPRVHFAINCAARSCPPIRTEPFIGARVSEQLDDQVRIFAAGEGLTVTRNGEKSVLRTTKIMEWFAEDFEAGGGGVTFLRKYMPAAKAASLTPQVSLEYADYSWDLNDWKR